jgi:two-component system response regulator FixJ
MGQALQPKAYVVDDDEAVRDSLRALFQSVGIAIETFASAEEFLASLDGSEIGCVLTNVRMPGLGGLELQRLLVEQGVSLAVIVITGYGDVEMVVRAMKAGARDFIEKPFNDQRILEQVRACLEESRTVWQEDERLSVVKTRLGGLTPRERAVLALMVEGKPARFIASELGISPKTVVFHRSHVMAKMGVESLAELIKRMLQLERRRDL